MARRRLTPAAPHRERGQDTGGDTGRERAPEVKSALPGLAGRPGPAGPAGPTGPPIAQVSGQAAAAAAMARLTAELVEARATGRMVLDLPLDAVEGDHLVRDRLVVNAEDFEALKASIRAHGQRSPAEVTPLPREGPQAGEPADRGAARFGLISGWRRLAALRALLDETGEARFATIRALARPPREARDSYVAMVEENEIRVGLSYYERARLVAEATARGVFEDQSQALRTLFATASRAKRSKIGSFIDIHEALGDVLRFAPEIPERLGLALVSRLRFGERVAMRLALTELADGGARTAEAELALLTRLAQPPVSHAKQMMPVSHAKQAGSVSLAKQAGSVSRAKQAERALSGKAGGPFSPGPDDGAGSVGTPDASALPRDAAAAAAPGDAAAAKPGDAAAAEPGDAAAAEPGDAAAAAPGDAAAAAGGLARETLRPGVVLETRQDSGGLSVRLCGPGVDGALIAALRRALRASGEAAAAEEP